MDLVNSNLILLTEEVVKEVEYKKVNLVYNNGASYSGTVKD